MLNKIKLNNMSLSNQTQSVSSPVVRYYTWSGSKGVFTYWDKETESKIIVKSIKFIPIDELSCVEGYSAKHDNGFRSNEVKATTTEELQVRWNKGQLICNGLYQDIKQTVEKLGGKYTKSIYAIEEIEDNWEIVNIKLKGAAFSSWINYDKSLTTSLLGLTITTGTSDIKKMGTVEYYEPTFKASQTPNELHILAVNMDVKLQDFFKTRNAAPIVQQDELTQEEKEQLKSLKKLNKTKTNPKKQKDEDEDEDDFFTNMD